MSGGSRTTTCRPGTRCPSLMNTLKWLFRWHRGHFLTESRGGGGGGGNFQLKAPPPPPPTPPPPKKKSKIKITLIVHKIRGGGGPPALLEYVQKILTILSTFLSRMCKISLAGSLHCVWFCFVLLCKLSRISDILLIQRRKKGQDAAKTFLIL